MSSTKRSSRKSGKRTTDLPTAWSDWEWIAESTSWCRYRVARGGEYEYEYQDPAPAQASAKPRYVEIPTPSYQPAASSTTTSSSYPNAGIPLYGGAQNAQQPYGSAQAGNSSQHVGQDRTRRGENEAEESPQVYASDSYYVPVAAAGQSVPVYGSETSATEYSLYSGAHNSRSTADRSQQTCHDDSQTRATRDPSFAFSVGHSIDHQASSPDHVPVSTVQPTPRGGSEVVAASLYQPPAGQTYGSQLAQPTYSGNSSGEYHSSQDAYQSQTSTGYSQEPLPTSSVPSSQYVSASRPIADQPTDVQNYVAQSTVISHASSSKYSPVPASNRHQSYNQIQDSAPAVEYMQESEEARQTPVSYGGSSLPSLSHRYYSSQQEYSPTQGNQHYTDDYATSIQQPTYAGGGTIYEEDPQFSQKFGQMTVHEDSEESEDSEATAAKKRRLRQKPQPQPTPAPKPCNHSGCAPQPDQDGPAPRRAPAFTESKTSKHRKRSPQRTKGKGSSTSHGRSRHNDGFDESVSLHESEAEYASEAKKEFDTWKAEYDTWKNTTCPCGFGYYTIEGVWISGEDVRTGKAPPKPRYEVDFPGAVGIGVH